MRLLNSVLYMLIVGFVAVIVTVVLQISAHTSTESYATIVVLSSPQSEDRETSGSDGMDCSRVSCLPETSAAGAIERPSL